MLYVGEVGGDQLVHGNGQLFEDGVDAFPLTLKLGKLKLRIQNMPNGNASITKKNYHVSQKICHAHMRWCFRQFDKGIFCKTAIETLLVHLKAVWCGTCGPAEETELF